MRRVLALLATAGMIAGSLVVREQIDDRRTRERTVVKLVCTTELASACDELARSRSPRVETTVEPAADTASRLSKPGDVDLDGWLVTPPWPETVDGERDRAGLPKLFASPGAPVARSPLVLVVQAARASVLRASCNNEIGWKCVGDAAPKPWSTLPGGRAEWGPVKPWHPDPSKEAVGLLTIGQATAAFLGRTDLSTIDLDDPAYLDWVGGLELAVRRTDGSVATMLTAPAQVDVVGTTEADAGPQIATAAATEKPVVLYPSPVATADVVLASVAGRDTSHALRSAVAGRGKRALAAAGWRVTGQTLAAGLRRDLALPARNGLPPAGLLEALRVRVGEIR